MDRTYLPILKQPFNGLTQDEKNKLMREFHEIIGAVVLLTATLSLSALTQLTGLRKGTIANRLASFRSVLSVPHDGDVPVRTLHLSFRDFLLNTDSGFRVDDQKVHRKIATRCLQILSPSN